MKEKSNSLLKILSLVIKYVILKLIEVVVQGDGFCRRGSRMSEKNYETSELKELNGNSGKYEANDVVGKTGTERCVTDVYRVCMGDGRISAGILSFF